MLRHKLRIGRLIAAYLAVALACVVGGSFMHTPAGTITFNTGAILLGALGPIIVIYFVLNGIFRVE